MFKKLKILFEWNVWLSGVMATYLTTTTACWLTLRYISMFNPLMEIVAIIIAFVVLILWTFLPIYVLYLAKKFLKLNSKKNSVDKELEKLKEIEDKIKA